MIQSLQSLRGIFIFFIFLHHLWIFDAGGDSAVSFFFILSGFVLARRNCAQASEPHMGRRMLSFMGSRLRKLWPLQIIMIAVVLVTGNYSFSLFDILVLGWDLLFLQAWAPIQAVYFSYNSVAWFLSDIVSFYLILFPLLRHINRISPRRRIASLLALLAVYFVAIQFVPDSLSQGLIYISPLFRSVDFILGIALWYVYRSLPQPLFSRTSIATLTLIQLAVIALEAICIYFFKDVSLRYNQASYWWIPSLLIIFIFTALDGSHDPLSRLLHLQPLVWFGNLSFEFYMVHGLTISTWRTVFPESSFLETGIACFFITLAGAAAVRKIIRLLDKPSRFFS